MRLLLLLAALALVPTGCGAGTDDASAPAPATVTVTQTETETVAAEPGAPGVECSATGLGLNLPEQELPEAVADVRQRVFDAAVECDYEALEQIALEQGEGFTFSYGAGPDDSAAEHWRTVEEAGAERPLPMRALATILTLPPSRNETGSYGWPTAYTEAPTDADWQALVDTGLFTQGDIDAMREGGMYLGYRTGITPEGDWQFFVAGD